MIYVDELRDYPNGKWCHMWSDGSREELDTFAQDIDLNIKWVQISRGLSGEFIHYDLRPSKRALALKLGATFMPLKDWIALNLPANP